MSSLEEVLKRKVKHRKSGIYAVSPELLEDDTNMEIESCFSLIQKSVDSIAEGWYIDSFTTLKSRGLLGKVKTFMKRLQRKLIHWYIEPVCDAESTYNFKLKQATEALGKYVEIQIEKNKKMEEEYREELESMRKRIADLEIQLKMESRE